MGIFQPRREVSEKCNLLTLFLEGAESTRAPRGTLGGCGFRLPIGPCQCEVVTSVFLVESGEGKDYCSKFLSYEVFLAQESRFLLEYFLFVFILIDISGLLAFQVINLGHVG